MLTPSHPAKAARLAKSQVRPLEPLNTHGHPSHATTACVPDAHSNRDMAENPACPEQPAGSGERQKSLSPLNNVTICTHNTTPASQDLAMLRLEFQSEEKPRTKQAAKRTAEDLLTPKMDAFINTGTHPFKCHRKPMMAFYVNDKTGMLYPCLHT